MLLLFLGADTAPRPHLWFIPLPAGGGTSEKETVEKYLANNNATLVDMVRYEVGEGIEKRQENFADEVMSQVKG